MKKIKYIRPITEIVLCKTEHTLLDTSPDTSQEEASWNDQLGKKHSVRDFDYEDDPGNANASDPWNRWK